MDTQAHNTKHINFNQVEKCFRVRSTHTLTYMHEPFKQKCYYANAQKSHKMYKHASGCVYEQYA